MSGETSGQSDRLVMCSAGAAAPRTAGQVPRDPQAAPSATITGKGTAAWVIGDRQKRVSVTEAAVIQGFPASYPWQGNSTTRYRQVGDAVPPLLAAAVVAEVAGLAAGRDAESTAPGRLGQWVVRTSYGVPKDDARNGTHEIDPHARPAHTVTGRTRDWRVTPAGVAPFQLDVDQVGALQGFPSGYPWSGSYTAVHQQAGDAVPPLLAAAIVAAVAGLTVGRGGEGESVA